MTTKPDTDLPASWSLSDYTTPSYLCWLVSRKCNLRCTHCISASSPDVDTADDLSTTECFRVVDKLAAGGIEQLDITGGEPLLRHDIVDIAEHAHERGIDLMITTNGTVGYEKYAALDAYDVQFRVSLDGVKKAHNRVRGAGTFEQTVEGIQRLSQRNASLMINSVVHAGNRGSLKQFIQFLDAEGIDKVCFAFFTPTGRGENNREQFGLTSEERRQAKAEIRKECSSRDIDMEIDDPDGAEFLLLMPDGTVVEQVKAGDSTLVGNILTEDFADTNQNTTC